MPALMLAAAAKEKDDDRGDGVCRRWGSAVLVKTRDWWGEAFGERDGGSELRSGAMVMRDSGVMWKEVDASGEGGGLGGRQLSLSFSLVESLFGATLDAKVEYDKLMALVLIGEFQQ